MRKVCWGQKGTKVNLVLRDRVERKVIGYVYKFSKLFLHFYFSLRSMLRFFSRVKWVYLDSLVSLVCPGFKVRPELQVFRVVTVAMEQTYVYLDPIFLSFVIYIYIDVRTSQTYGPDWFRVSLVRVVIPERLVPAVFEVLLG